MANIFYRGNDHLIEIDAAQATADGTAINDATVSVTVKTLAGATLVGPISMPYVTASSGKYQGILPYTMATSEGVKYTAEISFSGGAGLVGFWKFPFTAWDRKT